MFVLTRETVGDLLERLAMLTPLIVRATIKAIRMQDKAGDDYAIGVCLLPKKPEELKQDDILVRVIRRNVSEHQFNDEALERRGKKKNMRLGDGYLRRGETSAYESRVESLGGPYGGGYIVHGQDGCAVAVTMSNLTEKVDEGALLTAFTDELLGLVTREEAAELARPRTTPQGHPVKPIRNTDQFYTEMQAVWDQERHKFIGLQG